jgi:hypothetical protein
MENAHEHTGSAEAIRPSLRNGFTAYSVLSPVNGFVATVAARILPRDLTPASGRQDHTTSPYASLAARPRAKRATAGPASTASHPNVRDDHEPPLSPDETGGDMLLICGRGQE